MPRLAFRKTTPDGLSVDVEEYEGLSILLLTKEHPETHTRYAQVMGVATREINSPSVTWYYEYDMLPRSVSVVKLARYLNEQGFIVGVFDQFGNFRAKAA